MGVLVLVFLPLRRAQVEPQLGLDDVSEGVHAVVVNLAGGCFARDAAADEPIKRRDEPFKRRD